MYDKDKWINLINININIQDNIGTTPLMYASYYKRIEILKLLLTYKDINVNHQNNWKETALILAVFWNNEIIIKSSRY
jgi:ankyrin repeat protein